MASIYQGSQYDTKSLKKLLHDAQEAYHSLATGTQVVKITRNGRDVEFKQTDMQTLKMYIQDLQQSLGVNTGRSAPAGMRF